MSFQDLEAGRSFGVRCDLVNVYHHDATQFVAAGVFQINTSVSSFQRLVNSLGTSKDTPQLRDKLHKTRLHIGQLVKDTTEKLKEASETDRHTGVDPSKKIADAKLAKDFQAVLREFQKAQRLSAERETAYTPVVHQPFLPFRNTESELDIISNRSPERALMLESRRQVVLDVEMENEIAFNEAIIEEREQGIQEIQKEIGQVNEIFKDLAVLVREQGAVIDDISSHIESSHSAINQGTTQLVQASKIQTRNSSLSCLLLVMFGVALLIVVVVLTA